MAWWSRATFRAQQFRTWYGRWRIDTRANDDRLAGNEVYNKVGDGAKGTDKSWRRLRSKDTNGLMEEACCAQDLFLFPRFPPDLENYHRTNQHNWVSVTARNIQMILEGKIIFFNGRKSVLFKKWCDVFFGHDRHSCTQLPRKHALRQPRGDGALKSCDARRGRPVCDVDVMG